MSARTTLVVGAAAAVVLALVIGHVIATSGATGEVPSIALTGDGGPAAAPAVEPGGTIVAVLGEGTLSRGDAEAAALTATGGGEIADSELESEDGLVQWEVDVDVDGLGVTEVELDARDGTVLEAEVD